MIKKNLFSSSIQIDLGLARQIYREYLSKDYGYTHRILAEKLRLVWDYRDLNFNPKAGDILSSNRNIIMFDKLSENSKSIVGLFVYDKTNKIITRVKQSDIRGVEVVCGGIDEYVHANDEEKEIFFKAMSSLK